MNTKLIVGLVGLAAVVFAVCNMNFSNQTNEGFWNNVPRTVKVMREVHPKGKPAYSLQNNYQTMLGTNKFVSTPAFQSSLSPRFSNIDYGANIRYNMPSYENQGVPCDPLTMGNMARENYQQRPQSSSSPLTRENYGCTMGSCGNGTSGGCGGGCNVPTCGKGGLSLGTQKTTSGNSSPSYDMVMNNDVYSKFMTPVGGDLVAVGDMQTINADGTLDQPVVYDRYIYANQKSRLYAMGDPIRGDLPIVPCSGSWFNVSVTPSIDLRQGALAVIGGIDNSTNQNLASLQYNSSGRSMSTMGGVDMSNHFTTMAGAAGSDVNITSFP